MNDDHSKEELLACIRRLETAARLAGIEDGASVIETVMSAFDHKWPGACAQDCFDTSDGEGYQRQEAAREAVAEYLQTRDRLRAEAKEGPGPPPGEAPSNDNTFEVAIAAAHRTCPCIDSSTPCSLGCACRHVGGYLGKEAGAPDPCRWPGHQRIDDLAAAFGTK